MIRFFLPGLLAVGSFLPPACVAQLEWAVGARTGFSVVTGETGADAGFLVGPVGEMVLNRTLAVGCEIAVHGRNGTPIVWANQFRYYPMVIGSRIKPFFGAGFLLQFGTGGPQVGMIVNGGAGFWIARRLYIPAEVQAGPLFEDPTSWIVGLSTGIRYELP